MMRDAAFLAGKPAPEGVGNFCGNPAERETLQPLERKFERLQLQLLALGSQQGLWARHLPSCERLVFVVDASEEVDVGAVADTFRRAVCDSGLPEGTPVTVLLNKMDKAD